MAVVRLARIPPRASRRASQTGVNISDPFNRARLPITFDRVGLVRLFREFVDAMLEGRMPSPEARLFVASACDAYLQRGGNLTRDHLRISGPRGSHHTPAALAAALHRDERQADGLKLASKHSD
jgi:hypothetical protein